MSGAKKMNTEGTRFPCHFWETGDAEEAEKAFRGTLVRDYGEYTALEDGTVLHYNYMWDDGARFLTRCDECGGLVIMQRSEYHSCFDDDGDGYYQDWIPVASVEEADLMNILWGGLDLEGYPFRHLRGNNFKYSWTGGGAPKPYDPEELKEKIRQNYSGLKKNQKELLEKLISEAGKEEKEESLTPEEKIALGNEYNNRGWELQTGDDPDMEGAVSWYEKAAELGNATAMVNLGNICEEKEDWENAYRWYLEAAYAGDEKGMFNVANMYYWGEHVDQDYGKAYEYFRKLYEAGHPGVSLYMGLYAENGFLEEPDYEAAVRYYEQGIEEGDEYCPVNLGRMYCTGTGVPEDLQKGFELYMLGWERGDALAAANIGYCYEVGQGVRKNRKKAVEYYRAAAETGEEHAIEALERLGEEK
ncbi:MAG: sel1 repeat family protein [Clostridia bacterium]|nr:sel1 repeat family protein [Clostridia bacterium]